MSYLLLEETKIHHSNRSIKKLKKLLDHYIVKINSKIIGI